MKNTSIFFAVMVVIFGIRSDGIASNPYEEAMGSFKAISLEDLQKEEDPFAILKGMQSLSYEVIHTPGVFQDQDVKNFIEGFIFRASEETVVSEDINPLIMDHDTCTALREHLNRIAGVDPIPNADVAAQKEQEFLEAVQGYVADKKIQLHPDFVFEFCRETIGAMSKIRRKIPNGPFFKNDARGQLITRVVDDVIATKSEWAFNCYRLLATGRGPINGEELHFTVWGQRAAPYLGKLETYLFANDPHFINAALHPILQQDCLTAEQEKLSKNDYYSDSSNYQNIFLDLIKNNCTIKESGESIKLEGRSVFIDSDLSSKRDLVISTDYFQMLEPDAHASNVTLLSAIGKILIIAKKFDIHSRARFHAESVELVQLPTPESFEDRPKRVNIYIKTNVPKQGLSPAIDRELFRGMESEIFTYVWRKDPMKTSEKFPFTMQEELYHALKPFIWSFPPQREFETNVLYVKVQECVDKGLITFEEDCGYKFPPSPSTWETDPPVIMDDYS